jgi:two-component system, OmpR family, phosphate regulon response regulator PhoB
MVQSRVKQHGSSQDPHRRRRRGHPSASRHQVESARIRAVLRGDAISAVNQARKEHPDLILLDLMLPAGDGYLVMERLKAMPALEGIPVIVVSARDPVAEEERFIQSGADTFFRKPFDYDELRTAIELALGAEPAA